jgi:hypothetical protein
MRIQAVRRGVIESGLVTHKLRVYGGEVHSSDTFNGIGQPTSKRVSGTHRDLRPSYTALSSSQHSLPRCVSLFRLSQAKRTSSFAFPQQEARLVHCLVQSNSRPLIRFAKARCTSAFTLSGESRAARLAEVRRRTALCTANKSPSSSTRIRCCD